MLNDLSGFMMPSMPGAVQGAQPPTSAPIPPGPGMMPPEAAPPPMPPPPTYASPMAGPAPPPMMPAVGDMDPSELQYLTETQNDGTLLLRVRLPNGEIGPVVAHLPPPKLKGNSGPSKK